MDFRASAKSGFLYFTLATALLLPALASAQTGPTFSVNHQLWDVGSDILQLQQWLNANGYAVAQSGVGSPGHESNVFGTHTYHAVVVFQAVHGLPTTGFFGPLTRAAVNSLALSEAGSSANIGTVTASANSSTTGTTTATTSAQYVPGVTPLPGYAPGEIIAGGGGSSNSGSGGGGGGSSSDTTPPSVSLTAPSSGATVSGSSVTLTATASDNVAVISVQFKVDGTNIGGAITSSPYTTTWNSTGVSDGSHTLYAVARDTSNNYATSTSLSITVDNTPPVISNIASSTGASTSTITWTTDENATSKVVYGFTTAYGSASSTATLVTSHSIGITGLSSATTYHYAVVSTDSVGNTATSSDQTFTTAWKAIDSNALIVAPNGSDSNPGTLSQPILTLAHAQTLVRSASDKTVYLRAGTYAQTVTLQLTSSDSGETWSTYPGDPVDSAILDYTGQSFAQNTPGAPNGLGIGIFGGSNIAIDGLTVQNFPGTGIAVVGGTQAFGWFSSTGTSSADTISNNRVLNGNGGGPPFNLSDGTNSNGLYSTEAVAIWVSGASPSAIVENNDIENMMTTGITLNGIDAGGTGAIVRNNFLYNLNIAGSDSGAIYSQFSSGDQIYNNYLRDWKSTSTTYDTYARDVRAIYFDAGSTNDSATGNIIAGGAQDNIFFNGVTPDQGIALYLGNGSSSGQVFTGNIFDMGPYAHLVFINGSTGTGNEIEGNIIISNFSGNPSNSYYGSYYLDYSAGSPSSPTVANNVYYNYGGGTTYTTGDGTPLVSDSNPVTENPQISNWTYTVATSSAVFNSPVSFPGITGGWGPPDFTIPQTGTAPSSPH